MPTSKTKVECSRILGVATKNFLLAFNNKINGTSSFLSYTSIAIPLRNSSFTTQHKGRILIETNKK